MTSPIAGPPPCPSCGAPLAGTPTCASCGLRLTGPEAVRLWEVDQQLFALDGQRADLLVERGLLLAALRPEAAFAPAAAGQATAPSWPATDPYAVTAQPPSGPPPQWQSPVPQPRQEWT